MKKELYSFLLLLAVVLITGTPQLHAQTPRIDSVYPSKIYIGTLMTIKGSKLDYTVSASIGNANELILSSSDTQLVMMVMPGTNSGTMKLTTATNQQSIYAYNYLVLPSVPPIKQLDNKLLDNAGTSSQQGFSVAMSADGNTAAVGAADNTGGVLIYTRNNNIWTQQGNKLTGTGAAGNAFQGYSVAISAEGNTIIEGGVGDNGFTGASWIFVRDKNNVWSQQGNKLVGSGSIIVQGTTPEQGYTVSISADGNTAVTGGRRDNNYVGAAWIFTRSNNIWTEQQKLIGTGYINIINVQGTLQRHNVQMGSSVALSADGNTVLMGAPNDNNNTGAVWAFVRTGNAWVQQGNKLVGSGGYRSYYGGIQQGTSVAISADGNTLIEGAPFDSDSAAVNVTDNYSNGSASVYTRTGNVWTQQGNNLFASDASLGAEQGWSVSMSADGNTAIVGAPTDSGFVGGSWVYTRSNNIWSQASNKLLGTGYIAAPKQGWSTAISADGNTAIIGGPDNNPNGAAWVFADTTLIVLPVTLANFKAYPFESGIKITWTAYDEINLSSYDIERSVNGYKFDKLANIPAETNIALENIYTWFDASPFAGSNFYRIKTISKDGSVQYSPIIKIKFGNLQSSIQVNPNPVYGKKINLQLNNVTGGSYIISVYNANGEMQYRQLFQHVDSNSSVTIKLSKAAAGIYYVEMKNANNNYYKTIMIK